MEAEEQEEYSAVLQFLLALTLGEWNTLPQSSGTHDPGKAENNEKTLTQLGHLLSDELRTLIFHKSLVHPRKRYQFIQHGLFILDGDTTIRAMSGGGAAFLGLSENALYRSAFTSYLTLPSQRDFIEVMTRLLQEEGGQSLLRELHFIAAGGTTLRADCFISRLLYKKDSFIVTFFGLIPVVKHALNEKDTVAPKSLVAVQKVYDYIQTHKDGALPNAREFARRFGTNEYELKKEFKKRFGNSIYQCYTELRLQRAHSLILETDIPLVVIARQCGFEDYSGFAKAYVKQYGEPPAKARERNAE